MRGRFRFVLYAVWTLLVFLAAAKGWSLIGEPSDFGVGAGVAVMGATVLAAPLGYQAIRSLTKGKEKK